jgi:hypothetical protein
VLRGRDTCGARHADFIERLDIEDDHAILRDFGRLAAARAARRFKYWHTSSAGMPVPAFFILSSLRLARIRARPRRFLNDASKGILRIP